jgi:ABC-type nitrate/sulfonate/bicarbonate transport system substrate-binding protein
LEVFLNVFVRVRFLAAMALAAVALNTGHVAQADDTTLKIATLPIDPTAAIFYAQELGYFKKAGLNVEISSFTNGGASGAALAARSTWA